MVVSVFMLFNIKKIAAVAVAAAADGDERRKTNYVKNRVCQIRVATQIKVLVVLKRVVYS